MSRDVSNPDSASPVSAAAPTSPRERIQVIDVLRGFAIFGILVGNIYWNSWAGQPLVLTWTGPGDITALWFIALLVEGKFFSLFAFLFGLGFALQIQRAEARGVHFFPLYGRRLLVLLLIGLAQTFFLNHGGILTTYAMFGFLLLLFRDCSPRTTVRWAIIALLIPVAFFAARHVGFNERQQGNWPEQPEQVAEQMAAVKQRVAENAEQWLAESEDQVTYGEMTAQRVQGFFDYWSWPGFYPRDLQRTLMMFLLGLFAGRRRIFENLPAHLPFIRKVMWWGLGLGLMCSLGWVLMVVVHEEVSEIGLWNLRQLRRLPFPTALLGVALTKIQPLALSLFYASAIVLLAQRAAWKKWLAPLAPVGRMALSNYLFQSLVYVTLFYSYGLGLMGTIGPALLTVLSVFVFVLQILLSRWWLTRFRFGPVEWLWRTLTYGKPQPLRV